MVFGDRLRYGTIKNDSRDFLPPCPLNARPKRELAVPKPLLKSHAPRGYSHLFDLGG